MYLKEEKFNHTLLDSKKSNKKHDKNKQKKANDKKYIKDKQKKSINEKKSLAKTRLHINDLRYVYMKIPVIINRDNSGKLVKYLDNETIKRVADTILDDMLSNFKDQKYCRNERKIFFKLLYKQLKNAKLNKVVKPSDKPFGIVLRDYSLTKRNNLKNIIFLSSENKKGTKCYIYIDLYKLFTQYFIRKIKYDNKPISNDVEITFRKYFTIGNSRDPIQINRNKKDKPYIIEYCSEKYISNNYTICTFNERYIINFYFYSASIINTIKRTKDPNYVKKYRAYTMKVFENEKR